MKTAGHKRNIGINYLFNVFMNLNFTSGLWMIFLAIRGFSLVELGLLEGIYHITGFLMEVPTGIIADIWGRKASRIIGRIIWSLSLALMYFSPGFALQALGFCICALGNTLESGAGDALVYDSLLPDGAEEQYVKSQDGIEFRMKHLRSRRSSSAEPWPYLIGLGSSDSRLYALWWRLRSPVLSRNL